MTFTESMVPARVTHDISLACGTVFDTVKPHNPQQKPVLFSFSASTFHHMLGWQRIAPQIEVARHCNSNFSPSLVESNNQDIAEVRYNGGWSPDTSKKYMGGFLRGSRLLKETIDWHHSQLALMCEFEQVEDNMHLAAL
jgi:hypothetical protein